MAHVLGVDLGGTYLRAVVADARGTAVDERTERVGPLTASGLGKRVRGLAEELAPTGLAAVAVGLPGPVDDRGVLGPVVNAPGLSGAPVRDVLAEELDVPVLVDNDVNLAALGEQRHGSTDAADVCFIAVGTGIGMGIVVGGHILRGARGGAGELGLLPVTPSQAAAHPSDLGPLEAVAGGAGLAERWRAHTGSPASGRDVYRAAETGDPAATALLDDQASALAMAVRAVHALLDPELIVLGGGIGARVDVFERLQSLLSSQPLPSPPMQRTALGERAGVIGALEAARDLLAAVTPAATGGEL
jgi:glucokinase